MDSRISSRSRDAGFGVVVGLLLGIGLVYTSIQLYGDLVASPLPSDRPYILLGIALLIALGFEMVNGDTSNAVATVIYTNSFPPTAAVMWSRVFNFLGVLTSTGAVTFGIISLLPVELILQVGSAAGFAMVFALLIAAIIWNFGTWWLGIPNSRSHAPIGSIIGVGVANEIMARSASGTSGVDWGQALGVIKSCRADRGPSGAGVLILCQPSPIEAARVRYRARSG